LLFLLFGLFLLRTGRRDDDTAEPKPPPRTGRNGAPDRLPGTGSIVEKKRATVALRATIAERARRVAVPDGARLFGPGETCEGFMIPLTGAVRVEHVGANGRSVVLYRVGPGESCDASGSCRQQSGSCANDVDCGKGRRCGPLHTCLLAARSCFHDEGCVSGEVCEKRIGECIPRPRCESGLSCPTDFTCDEPSSLCRRSCLGPGECGPGEHCEGGVCSGALTCATDQACGAGLICDPLLGYCRPSGAGLCAPCTHDRDCGGPNDFCLVIGASQACGRSCATESCPVGYTCNTGLTPPQCLPASGSCP